ncbi:hypothetical protein GCM10009654_50260 [Streptomyces hebeiensis]|uniref:Uncharacterized protein n=1 Tax=Streptomyces hebeiensis TaxID=229486 RepID=A0ABN1V078_9ACTN
MGGQVAKEKGKGPGPLTRRAREGWNGDGSRMAAQRSGAVAHSDASGGRGSGAAVVPGPR